MRNNPNTTDGFVVRRRHNAGGGSGDHRPTLDGRRVEPPKRLLDIRPVDKDRREREQVPMVERRQATAVDAFNPNNHAKPHEASRGLDGLDIGVGEDIDRKDLPSAESEVGKKQRKPRGKIPVKRIIKWSAISLAVIGLAIGGYFIYKLISAGGQIFKGNLVNAVFAPAKELAKDENGRSNVLIFGTSEDDPGHDGADLTDSMMIISANQENKDAFLISIPRDLYVDYGRACPAGYQGKINALYSCVKDMGEEAAQEVLRKKIGEVFGLDVQYSAHVNYTVLREAVDAVGGITVTIDSSDPRGIMDRNFDWDCPNGPYTCYNVRYPNGPANLNGKQALYLARARGASGVTYGLPQANFDREKYQQAILVALKDKAVSAGTLANPVAVNNLLDTLGKNVRTNFNADEVKTIVDLAQKVDTANISSLQLNDPENLLVTTGNVNGQSVVRPVKGLYNYSGIHEAVRTYASSDKSLLEGAIVDVFNASGVPGVATTKSNQLKDEGITVGTVANAPESLNTEPLQLYDLSDGKKPATRQKLEKLLGVTAKVEPAGGITGITSSADFVVIIGTSAE